LRKTIALATLMLTLLTMTALMPTVGAIAYYWDGILFVEGDDIKYPHPSRELYEISPYSYWSVEALQLYHHQIDQATSLTLYTSVRAVAAFCGTLLGTKIGGTYGTVIGFVAGLVLVVVITWVAEKCFLDELNCIWWWISIRFVDFLIANALYLGPLCIVDPVLAQTMIMGAFLACGYFRVGSVTFYDGIYVGKPEAPEENPPISGGGCPILSVWNGTDYYEEGLVDIHNPEGIDLITNHTLVSTPQRVGGAYLMRLVEHPKTHSYIDEVKLYATTENGTTIELPLIWARHSEYGNVLPQLLFSDEWKTDTLGADYNNGTSQSIDLKFAGLSPHLKIVSFTFQIEGNNRSRK